MTIPQHIRIAHEATDEVLMRLDGLVCALDVIEDRLALTDHQSRESKAFHIIRPLLAEKIAELWKLRDAEWRAIGGKAEVPGDVARKAESA